MTNECSWDGPSMAPSSGEPYECHDEGTVFHLGAQVFFCRHHFLKFDEKFGEQFPVQYAEPQLSGTCIEGLFQIVANVKQRIGAGL